MNKIFQIIGSEAQFTKEILGSGVTQLGKTNYGQKGVYFQAFTSISTGLERIGKLCVILDYYIDNKGVFPKGKFEKIEVGHDLEKLFLKSKEIINKHKVKFHFSNDLTSDIHTEILSILSNFAKGDRYSNFNFLVASKSENDPIKDWSNNIDQKIFEQRVSNSKKEKVKINAQQIDQMIGKFTLMNHSDELVNEITDVDRVNYLTGITDAILKFRQLYILQIIRYWVEILRDLQYKAMSFNNQDIPFMTDIFAMFLKPDSYFKTRNTF